MLELNWLVLIVFWIASAAVAAHIAEAKGLQGSAWALAVFFLGPIGLIGVASMPDRRLRQYMRLIAIKLEAIEEKESIRLETTPVIAQASSSQKDYIFVDKTLKDQKQIMAAVFAQLSEDERAIASIEKSELRLGRGMGFIRDDNNKVILRLAFIFLKDGKYVWTRSWTRL